MFAHICLTQSRAAATPDHPKPSPELDPLITPPQEAKKRREEEAERRKDEQRKREEETAARLAEESSKRREIRQAEKKDRKPRTKGVLYRYTLMRPHVDPNLDLSNP